MQKDQTIILAVGLLNRAPGINCQESRAAVGADCSLVGRQSAITASVRQQGKSVWGKFVSAVSFEAELLSSHTPAHAPFPLQTDTYVGFKCLSGTLH